MKRLAFVIQRYGRDVNGGAEELCRQVAERLCGRFEIEVLTSCARDYLTWENHYRPGRETLEGVTVRRFPTARTRRVRSFGRLSNRLYRSDHTFAQEADWMERQGPDVPDLYRHIESHRDGFDLFVFFTYLYPPTFFGLPLVAEKSLLVPCAHDEPPLRLGMFRALFHLPRGLIFNTEGERKFVHQRFRNSHLPWIVAGAGVVVPALPDSKGDAAEYLLYLGRVDVEKGCGELFDYFEKYKARHPSSLALLLAGEPKMRIPRRSDIVPLGFVSEASKASLLAGAMALVMPSRHESLSLAALESWAAGTPVLAHGGSAVLADHVEHSGGGWLYSGYRDFSRALDLVLTDGPARSRLGRAGRNYVARNYSWERVLETYEKFFHRAIELAGMAGADRH